jgi:hypothetical protein
MKNKNGFVMTETLIVTVFLITIFTFIYVSVVPLMGTYDDMAYRDADLDIVYKLYNVRKMINRDSHKNNILLQDFEPITCSNLDDENYCDELMDYLELRSEGIDNYILIYTSNIHDNLENFNNYEYDTQKEMYNYLAKHANYEGKVLVLLDKNNHTIAYLAIR